MNQFLIFFMVLALAMGLWLSRNDWLKMLVLVPFGALVPAFFGTASMCGLGFALHLTEAGTCAVAGEPYRLFAAYFVFGLGAVLVASVVVKLGRVALGLRKG